VRPYPFKFYEIYKSKIWGGRRMESALGKRLAPEVQIGESWELVDHFDDVSVVRGGLLEGVPLRELWKDAPSSILGKPLAGRKFKEFPLLVKFIDASGTLSVQVHPDEAYAREHDPAGESGKNEAWYVVSAGEGAELTAGLADGVSRKDFKRLLDGGQVEECLNRVKVKPGDLIHIAAGTVHSIGPGILILEIQQTSDATYRVWDWGRTGQDGKPRPLHVEHALKVIDFSRGPVGPAAAGQEPEENGKPVVVDRCDEFVIEKVTGDKGFALASAGDRFSILVCVSGSGSLLAEGERYSCAAGDTILLPAAIDAVAIEPAEKIVFLRAYIP